GNGAADDDEHRDGTRPHEEHRQDGGGDRRQLGGLGFGEEVPQRGDRPVDDGADDVEQPTEVVFEPRVECFEALTERNPGWEGRKPAHLAAPSRRVPFARLGTALLASSGIASADRIVVGDTAPMTRSSLSTTASGLSQAATRWNSSTTGASGATRSQSAASALGAGSMTEAAVSTRLRSTSSVNRAT